MTIRQRAYYHYREAVRKGILSPGKVCLICGIKQSQVVKGSIIEHHEDYDKPLETITLCSSCHVKLHQTRKKGEDFEKALVHYYRGLLEGSPRC